MERILFLSDLHDCPVPFYDLPTAPRLDKLIADLKAAGPFDRTFILGDVSLDFWLYNGGGSWQNKQISHTAHFMETYAKFLPQPMVLIPGNHEQYGDRKWAEITGFTRSNVAETSSALFIFADTFRGVLDPKEPSDGQYAPVDCSFIRSAMENCPQKPVFLCAHYFDMNRETPEFNELLAENDRITALFMGHTHHSSVLSTGTDAGEKPILQTGNYSYSGLHDHPENSFWGWRELLLHDDGRMESFYHVPASVCGNIRTENHNQDYWEKYI